MSDSYRRTFEMFCECDYFRGCGEGVTLAIEESVSFACLFCRLRIMLFYHLTDYKVFKIAKQHAQHSYHRYSVSRHAAHQLHHFFIHSFSYSFIR